MREPLLTSAEVADWIGKKTSWLADNRDVIPYHRIGREVRYDPADVREFLRRNRVGVAAEPSPMLRRSSRRRTA